jgi:transposase
MTNDLIKVIAGVDTHADTHHVALISQHGTHLADEKFVATGSGYRAIIGYITQFGPVIAVGIEGTGSYGAGLARVLAIEGFEIVEVNRTNRQSRRLRGKSDPLDAYQAAEAVLAGRGTSTPKTRDGYVEALRVLRTARTSAIKARTAVLTQISGILVSAPEAIRAKYRGQTTPARLKAMAALRPDSDTADPAVATAITLKRLARRHQHLTTEIEDCDTDLARIISENAPALTHVTGVGTAVASQLLVTIGDNPERLGSEAQFAALAGVAPIPASSGKTTRHRLSRGGDRAANSAIHHIVLARMSTDQRTKDYVAKRTKDGKTKREIMLPQTLRRPRNLSGPTKPPARSRHERPATTAAGASHHPGCSRPAFQRLAHSHLAHRTRHLPGTCQPLPHMAGRTTPNQRLTTIGASFRAIAF